MIIENCGFILAELVQDLAIFFEGENNYMYN
jgi:hypothetical protein